MTLTIPHDMQLSGQDVIPVHKERHVYVTEMSAKGPFRYIVVEQIGSQVRDEKFVSRAGMELFVGLIAPGHPALGGVL